MSYITRSNFGKTFLIDEEIGIIVVERLNGTFHKYRKLLAPATIHSKIDCKRMLIDFNDSYNSDAVFVSNYVIIKVNETFFREISVNIEDFTRTLFFELGFSACLNCWKIEPIKIIQPEDFLLNATRDKQHENNLASLKKYLKQNPDKYNEFYDIE